MFGAVEFFETCQANDIKPVLGLEAYMARRSRFERTTGKDEKNYDHLILLARNNTGWKNLMRLSTVGYLEGFYYKPRIDMEILRECSEGLIATTACVAGVIPRAILAGDMDKARELTRQFQSLFGEENFYFELQDHGIAEEKIAFKAMVELGKEMGVPFIVANDAHYLTREDAASHELLLCLQTQTTLDNPNRFKFSTDEIYFKSPEEMATLFPQIPEAMSNTVEIASRCEVSIKSKPQLPVPDVPTEYDSADGYLRGLAEEGLRRKYGEITEQLKKRLDYELEIITSMGFSGYFLIVRDFVIAAKEMGVMVGCRGSAAGSLVAYVTDITDVDPIKFDLIFERFLNPERISMPDADIDFADKDRYRVIEYVVQKYGREAVCQIINFGRMKAKMVVKDVARVMGIAPADAQRLANMVTEKTLDKSVSANSELAQVIESNPTYKQILQHGKVLEGIARQAGMHAGGVIIAPGKVVDWAPLFKQPGSDLVMTQFDMNYVEKAGLIKMDFLGLRTLTVLQEALRLVKKYHDRDIDLWKLPDGDDQTYKLFGKGETTGVFQFESQGMQDYLCKLKPSRIEDLIAMAALYRPGPMSNIDTFINRKHGKEPIEYAHPMLKDILDVTYGIIVYQEQVMRIAQMMGGFSLGQADMLRKAMGKKKVEIMAEMGKKFVAGAKERDIDPKVAQEVYDLMAKFAEYGFNKAHATVYAHVSYQAGFLKAHYPLEYMTANLTSWIGNQDQFLVMKNEAERMGIKVQPPDINRSEFECSIDEGCIRLGLGTIKNTGKASETILEARAKKGPFSSIFDLCASVDLRHVNKKSLESFICAGALDSMPGTRAQQFAAIEQAHEYGNAFQRDRMTGQTSLFDMGGAEQVVEIPEPTLPEVAPWPYTELLAKEKDVLNFYVSGHPLDNYRDEVVGFSTLRLDPDSLQAARNNQAVTVGGMITSFRTHTQRNGKLMAFIELEEFDGSIEVIVFADAFEQYRHLLAADAMVLLRGTVMKEDQGGVKLRMEKAMPLSESRDLLTKSVHIRMRTAGLEDDFIKDVYAECNDIKGTCALVIHLVTTEENEFKIKAGNVAVGVRKEALDRLRNKLGRDNVWLSRSAA
jgi:DNA polymerase-3 subunit alpha